MRAAWELAKFKTQYSYQFLKKLFIAVRNWSVCCPKKVLAGEECSHCTVDGCHNVEDLGSNIPVHGKILVPCASLQIDLCTIASRGSMSES